MVNMQTYMGGGRRRGCALMYVQRQEGVGSGRYNGQRVDMGIYVGVIIEVEQGVEQRLSSVYLQRQAQGMCIYGSGCIDI